MKTINEKAKEYAADYNGSGFANEIACAYHAGADEAMRQPWIRWADRKPEEELPVIIIHLNYDYGNPAYDLKFFGPYKDKIAKRTILEDADNLYWLPLPGKGKEEEK